MPQRILIAGIDTPIGANLALQFASRFDVGGVALEQPVWVDECQQLGRSYDGRELVEIARTYQPDWVIYCGAESLASWDVSPRATGAFESSTSHPAHMLAMHAVQTETRMAVICSDAHYCGPRMFHGEDETPRATVPWAQRVATLEHALPVTGVLHVRTHSYGWSPRPETQTFAERLWRWFLDEQPMTLDPQRWATPLATSDLAALLLRAFRRHLVGTIHLGGAERISQLEFARAVASAMGLRTYHLPPTAYEPASRLHETSLRSNRARRELETALPAVRVGLERFLAEATTGYALRMGTPISKKRQLARLAA